MPDMNQHLDALGAELAGLLKADDAATETVMTPEAFVAYATEQMALAKSDKDPTERLEHLAAVVELAKAHGWEESDTFSVSVYSGPLSVSAGSRQAEKIAEHPGKGLGVSQEAPVASGGFEGASGVTGPASNTAAPAARYMPPAFPESTPAASAEGWMSKAAVVLKSHGEDALLAELTAMLGEEAQPDDGKEEVEVAKNDDVWPDDLATESFLADKPAVAEEDNFGPDATLEG